jgi:hypothetical protein
MPLTPITKEWGDFSHFPEEGQVLMEAFVASLNPKIDKLNKLIERYNSEENIEKKVDLLNRIARGQRIIDSFYPDNIVSACPKYIKKMHRTLVEEIQAERGVSAEPTDFTELLETIPPRKLDKMLRILLKPGFKQENLSDVYKEDEKGREAFLALCKVYDIAPLRDGNSSIFEVTRKKKPKDKLILKIENRMGQPRKAAMHLRENSMKGYFNPVYAERQATCKNPRSNAQELITRTIQTTKFQKNEDLDMQGCYIEEAQPKLRLKKAARIFRQMAGRMLGAQQDNIFIFDAKSTNWVDDAEVGELLFHDDKSPVFVNDEGLVDLTSDKNKSYDMIYSDYMCAPEMNRYTPFSADKAHVYMLGKNLYQYLTGRDCNAFIEVTRKANGQKIERFIHSADELDFPTEIFGTKEGKRYEALIRQMIQPEASARCLLDAAKKELASIEGVQLNKELNQELEVFRDASNTLIKQIKAFKVSDKDTIMQNYIAAQSEAVKNCKNVEEFKKIRKALHEMHQSLHVNRYEIHDVKNKITSFKDEGGWNMEKKAQKIETAMCAVPLEERGEISDGKTSKTKAVLDAMAWKRKLGKSKTFQAFKAAYQGVRREVPKPVPSVEAEDKKKKAIKKPVRRLRR